MTAFRAGSALEGGVLFLAYAAGMGLVVAAAAVAVALARRGVLDRVRRAGSVLPRIAGALLLASSRAGSRSTLASADVPARSAR